MCVCVDFDVWEIAPVLSVLGVVYRGRCIRIGAYKMCPEYYTRARV